MRSRDEQLLERLRGLIAALDPPAPHAADRARAAFTLAMLERAAAAPPRDRFAARRVAGSAESG